MSSIDERVVQMQFENSQFEKGIKETVKSLGLLKKNLNLDNATDSIEHLQKVGDSFSLAKISSQLDKIVERTSWFGRTIRREIDSITAQTINLGKSLSVGQIGSGWSKYEQKTSSVQTIINATGKSIDEVNGYLDKLMWFSDETSYNFTEMTAALGTLTSSGGNIEKMIPMIEGMATATAFAGKSANEFSRVIYNLNQSYSQGYLSLMDWKSVELAQVGSEQLKQTLIDTAVELGTLKKLSDGTFKTKKGTIVNAGNMGSTLNEKWATKEVMEGAFGKFSQVIEEAYKLVEAGEFDTAADAIASLAGKYDETYYKAAKAAQEAKSFKEAIDATADAVSSGWMKTFELIFGNYDEARVLWTDLANALWEVFASGAEQRNETLEAWKEAGGRADLIQGITDALSGLWNIITAVKEAFIDIFPKVTTDKLLKFSKKVKELGANFKKLANSYEYFRTVGKQLVTETNPLEEYFGNLEKGAKGEAVKKLQEALEAKGFSVGKHGIDGIFGKDTEKALKEFQESIGETADGIYKEADHAKLVGTITGSRFEYVYETVKKYTPFLDKVQRIARGFFAGISIIGKGFLFLVRVGWKLLNIFAPIGNIVLTALAKLGDKIVELNDAIGKSGKIEEWLTSIDEFLAPAAQSIKDFSDAIIGFINGKKVNKATETVNKYSGFIENIKSIFSGFANWISKTTQAGSFFDSFHIYDLVITAAGIMLGVLSSHIIRLVGKVVGIVENVKKITGSIKSLLAGFKWGSRAKNLNLYAEAMMKIAFAVALMAGSVYVLSRIDWGDLAKGVLGLAAIMGIIIGSIWALGKVSKKIRSIDKVCQNLLVLAASVAILAVSVTFLANLSWEELARGLLGVVTLLGAISGFLWLSKKFGKLDTGSIVALGAIASALLGLVKSVVILGSLDNGSMARGIAGLVILMTALEGFMLAMSKIKMKASSIFSLIPVVLAIDLLAVGFIGLALTMKSVDDKALARAGVALVGMMTALAVFMKAMNAIHPSIGAVLSVIPVVLAIDLLAVGFIGLALTMKSVDDKALARAGVALVGMMTALAVFMKAMNAIHPSIGAVLSVIPVVLAIDLLAVGFIGLALTMKSVDDKALARAGVALVGMMTALAVFMKAMNAIHPSIGAVLSVIPVVLAIDLLAVGFIGLALTMKSVDDKALARAGVALVGMMTALAVFMAVANKIKPSVGAITGILPIALGMSILLVSFSYAIRYAKDVDFDTLISLAAGIGVVFIAFGAACRLAGKMNISAGLGVLAASLSVVLVIAAMAIGLRAIKDVDTEKIKAFAISIVGVITSLVTIFALASLLGVGKMATGAAAIGAAFAVLGTIIIAFLSLVGLLNSKGGLVKLIDSAGAVLKAIGKAFGNIAAGYMEAIGEGMAAIRDGVGGLSDNKDLEKDLEAGFETIQKVTDFLNEFSKEGSVLRYNASTYERLMQVLTNIKQFGEAIGAVSEGINGLSKSNYEADTDAATKVMGMVAEALIGLQDFGNQTLWEKKVTGGISSWWKTTGTMIGQILTDIERFGTVVQTVRDAVSGLSDNTDKDGVSKVEKDTTVATKIVGQVADALSSIGTLASGSAWATPRNLLASWWLGSSSQIDYILKQVGKFGNIAQTVREAVSGLSDGGTDKNGKYKVENDADVASKMVESVVTALDSLATLSEGYTWYKAKVGLAGYLRGYNNQLDPIIDTIGRFADTAAKVRDAVTGISTDRVKDKDGKTVYKAELETDVSTTIIDKIVSYMTTLTNDTLTEHGEDWSDWMLDNQDVADSLIRKLDEFTPVMSRCLTSIKELELDGIEADAQTAINAVGTVVEFFSGLSDYDLEGSKSAISAFFSGDNVTDSMISRLGSFAESAKKMFDNFAGMSETTIEADANVVMTIFKEFMGLLSWFNTNSYDGSIPANLSLLSQMSGLLTQLGTSIVELTDEVDGANMDTLQDITDFLNGLNKTLAGIKGVEDVAALFNDLKSLFTGGDKDTEIPSWIDSLNSDETASKLSTFVSTFLSTAKPEFETLKDSFKSSGYNLGIGLGNGLTSSSKVVKAVATAWANGILAAINKALGIQSPSRKTMETAKYMTLGFTKGMDKYSESAEKSLDWFGNSMLGKSNDILAELSGALASDVDFDPVVRPVVDLSDVVSSSKRMNGLLSADRSIALAGNVSGSYQAYRAEKAMAKAKENSTSEANSTTNDSSSVNVNGNFYIRSEQDVKSLASEIAALTKQQQRSLGASY